MKFEVGQRVKVTKRITSYPYWDVEVVEFADVGDEGVVLGDKIGSMIQVKFDRTGLTTRVSEGLLEAV